MDTDLWRYAPSIDLRRIDSLCAVSSFDEIGATIAGDVARPGGIQYEYEEGKTEYTRDFWRPRYFLAIDSITGDRFFNSPCGYRAHYAISVGAGEELNRKLLSRLHVLLIKKTPKKFKQIIQDIAAVENALQGNSAKAWVWRHDGQVDSCLIPTEPEILVPTWVANWRIAKAAGVEELKKSRDKRPRETPAIWGVRLHGPTITRLVVYGAWLDSNGQVQLPPPDKRDRSLQIHEFGFA